MIKVAEEADLTEGMLDNAEVREEVADAFDGYLLIGVHVPCLPGTYELELRREERKEEREGESDEYD